MGSGSGGRNPAKGANPAKVLGRPCQSIAISFYLFAALAGYGSDTSVVRKCLHFSVPYTMTVSAAAPEIQLRP